MVHLEAQFCLNTHGPVAQGACFYGRCLEKATATDRARPPCPVILLYVYRSFELTPLLPKELWLPNLWLHHVTCIHRYMMHDHMHTILIGFGRSYRVRQERWRFRDTGDRHLSPILTVAANFAKEIACENVALKCQADEAQTCLDRDPEKMEVLDYPVVKYI